MVLGWLYGLALAALLAALEGLSGCVPASRDWVREQLAPMQAQMGEMQDRVTVVEQQFERLDPKVDRILAHMEQQGDPVGLADPPSPDTMLTWPLPVPSQAEELLPAGASLDFTIIGKVPPPLAATSPPAALSVRSRKPLPIARPAEPDCLLQTLKGQPC
jgi:hypothetical protein